MPPFIRICGAGDQRDIGWLRADQFSFIDQSLRHAHWPSYDDGTLPKEVVGIHPDSQEGLLEWLNSQ